MSPESMSNVDFKKMPCRHVEFSGPDPLGRLRRVIPEDTSLLIYKTMILPVMDYCSFYTGSATQSELTKLQQVQNRGLRICTLSRTCVVSVNALHTVTSTLKLEDRRKRQLTKMMWKKALQGEVEMAANVRTRGDRKLKFKIRRAKTSFYQKGPFYRGVTLWDKLAEETQKLKDTSAFNIALKKLYPASYN